MASRGALVPPALRRFSRRAYQLPASARASVPRLPPTQWQARWRPAPPAAPLCRRPYSTDNPLSGDRLQDRMSTPKWTFEQVQSQIDRPTADIVIIDVRERKELLETGTMPGAINVPITSRPDSFHIDQVDWEDRFDFPRPSKDKTLLFYCKAGVRSHAAAELAKSAGYHRVIEYPGSWLDWAKNGGAVVPLHRSGDDGDGM